ncbi:restriction endonuclease subunit S [Selenomonas sp. oral taxon 149]|uniref:restriction endonuclease subunit S n=1 Tax=Selenomonas sp. oral taxon 149 TaxID=712535 RepID=UPI0001E0D368|nr:restriction endonuclease subunit S [Selenomonas sp. oral taxon 149]EFM22545.1 type I restriction modification DNA specificity domain protein [Selenomonas sp. oral taxon 149 str. 67H29BP]
MSRLREMIKELCPDGVEYKKLGEIATNVFRGAGIKRDELTAMGIPCVRYGEIYTTYGIWFDSCVSHTDETFLTNPKYFGHGDILFAITGESVEEIAKSTAYIGHDKCVAGGDIVVLQHEQNPKYLSYVLSTEMAQRQKSKGRVKSKVVHSSVPAIKEIVIPVPPLPIQNEIVKMLDNFTELTAELTAELTLRKKQYSFYRDSLLNFSRDDVDVEWKTLGDVCDILSGYPFDSSQFVNNGIRLMRGMNVKRGVLDFQEGNNRYWKNTDGLDKYKLKADDIIIAMDGSLVGQSYGLVKKEHLPLLLVQRVARVRSKESNSHYVYHYISSGKLTEYVNAKRTAGAVPHISLKDIEKFEIPFPDIEKQNKIAEILDRFDALCNDLTQGLPAEIAARKKQYEYYRDKRLTFRRKEA